MRLLGCPQNRTIDAETHLFYVLLSLDNGNAPHPQLLACHRFGVMRITSLAEGRLSAKEGKGCSWESE
jgi:hypothetical protein